MGTICNAGHLQSAPSILEAIKANNWARSSTDPSLHPVDLAIISGAVKAMISGNLYRGGGVGVSKQIQ
jgi:hypothetical protein